MGNTNAINNVPINEVLATPSQHEDVNIKSNQSAIIAITPAITTISTSTIISKKTILNTQTHQTIKSRSINTTPSNLLTLLNPFTLYITDKKQEIYSDIISTNKQIRANSKILMLHGWRTSGKILSMQSAALRNNISIDCTFVDAPFIAQGEPSPGIDLFYPNHKYYEWLYSEDTLDNLHNNSVKSTRNSGNVEESLILLLEFIKFHGPFDGILGFSQGGDIATRLAEIQQKDNNDLNTLFKFVILVGGVVPKSQLNNFNLGENKINMPSLHIIGEADPYKENSRDLYNLYQDDNNRSILYHNEGHNIPSVRTGIYKDIEKYIHSHNKNK